MLRRIVQINKELCNGCGICLKACHEAAIVLKDGKAELLNDIYCDGLGDCLKGCPQGAIDIIEREAEVYDEEAVKRRVDSLSRGKGLNINQGCRSIVNNTFGIRKESELMQWPVQLQLINPGSDFLQNSNLLIAAQCSAFSHKAFHDSFMKDRITIIACPKLSDKKDNIDRFKAIFKMNNIKSVMVVNMEVPCCNGLSIMVMEALKDVPQEITFNEVTIRTNGEIL